jgi:hypothetical protein
LDRSATSTNRKYDIDACGDLDNRSNFAAHMTRVVSGLFDCTAAIMANSLA